MGEGIVQVAPDSTGKKIRTQEVTEGLNTVEQQVVTLAKADGTLVDPTTVSVSNFPATQAVSAVSLPLPTGAAQDSSLTTIASDIAAQAKLTDTQPVSLAALPNPTNLDVALSTRLKPGDTLTAVTTVGTITNPVAVTSAGLTNLDVALSTRTKPADQQHTIIDSGTVTAVTAITNPLPAGTNLIGHVDVDVITPPTLTKGTQGSTGFSTQDLKDAGRTAIVLFLDAVTGITSEALGTMSINKGGAAQTAATSYTVTAGKTLRISGMHTSVKNTSTVASDSRTRLRQASSSFSVSSPIVLLNEAGSPAAIANAVGTDDTVMPDGFEIAGGQIIGISHVESATTCTISVMVVGYEY